MQNLEITFHLNQLLLPNIDISLVINQQNNIKIYYSNMDNHILLQEHKSYLIKNYMKTMLII
jgi:hypothetical protein